MKRKVFSLLVCLAFILAMIVPVFGQTPRIVDEAQLLTWEEEQMLEDMALEFATAYSLDAVILTVDRLMGSTISSYADDYYDQMGYGVGSDRSGLILVVAMEERELYISTCGEAIQRLSDRELDGIIENISPNLSNGNYYDAFELFFGFTTLELDWENSTTDVEVSNGINWMISLVSGVAVAAVIVWIMASCMNTKRKQHSAGDYLRQGSYDLKNRQDIFLYSQVSKVKREQNKSGGSSVHSSSGGTSHGGRGGRF